MTKRASDLHPGINRRTLLAAAAGTVLLPASVRAQAPQPSPGGTLRVAMPFNPAALDPMTGRNVPDFNTVYTIFDALIDFDPETLELRPMLAKAWRYNRFNGLKLFGGIGANIDFRGGQTTMAQP